MDLKSPVLSDREAVCDAVQAAGYKGSDACFGNIFLLRNKYGTIIDVANGFLFRYYSGGKNRTGYTFPLGKGNMEKALGMIEEDSRKNGRPLQFCFVTDEQKKQLSDYFGSRLVFGKDRGDADYIYSAEALSSLSGKLYQKKRNHISKFSRTYDDFELRPLTPDNFSDALKIEEMWLKDEDYLPYDISAQTNIENEAEKSEDVISRLAEYGCIKEALTYFDELCMRGAVLYVYGRPVAMTMASEIIRNVWDIHFEKVIGEYALNGGYAVINKLFASALCGAELINREEDINIEGLRKAKLSYYPTVIFEKSYACAGKE